jgi:CRP-like cAMP-binding protein
MSMATRRQVSFDGKEDGQCEAQDLGGTETLPGTPGNGTAEEAAEGRSRVGSKATKRWKRTRSQVSTVLHGRRNRTAAELSPEVWREFERVDTDHEGVLNVEKLGVVLKRLGMKMSKKELNKTADRLAAGAPGRRITLGSLDHWWHERKLLVRQELRTEAKSCFDRFSVAGALQLDEFYKMIADHGSRFGVIDHDDLEPLPALDETGAVTWASFETWWKEHLGIQPQTTDVLPEYLKLRLDEEMLRERKRAAKRLGLHTTTTHVTMNRRTAAQLWDVVRIKWRHLNRMSHVWGKLDQIYQTTDVSAYGNTPLPQGILDPDSQFCSIWDMVSVIFLFYVVVTVPLNTSFAVVSELWSLMFFVDLVVDLFFIGDVFLNFRTAYVDKHGHREGRPWEVAKNYAKGWFTIDIVSCLPVQYMQYIMEASQGSDGADGGGAGDRMKVLKSLRLMRLAKMLRIARLRKMITKYSDDVQTAQWLPAISMTFVILFLCHVLACLWYFVGDGAQELKNGALIVGWVYQEEPWFTGLSVVIDADGTTGGWDHMMSSDCVKQAAVAANMQACPPLFEQVQGVKLATRYATSLYYVFNALEHGFTDGEKLVAVISELTLGLIYGMLAGLISSVLIVMGSGEAEIQAKTVKLRQWMKRNHLPRNFQTHALEYFHRVWEEKMPTQLEEELYAALPPDLSAYITQELYGKTLRGLPIFKGLGEDFMAELCDSVNSQIVLKGQNVVTAGETGTDFFVLLRGELKILEQDARSPDGLRFLGYLSEGSFFGEVPMLSNYAAGSEVRTRTVQAVTESSLCYITREKVKKLRGMYPELDARLRRFAMVGGQLSTKQKETLRKNHGIDTMTVRILQEQNARMLMAQADGGIELSLGQGHRATLYTYEHITEWSVNNPHNEALAPVPPTESLRKSPRRGSNVAEITAKIDLDEAAQAVSAAVPSGLRDAVVAACARNQTDGDTNDQNPARSSSIWIKTTQGEAIGKSMGRFRPDKWREVFPFGMPVMETGSYGDNTVVSPGNSHSAVDAIGFTALETLDWEKFTSMSEQYGTVDHVMHHDGSLLSYLHL